MRDAQLLIVDEDRASLDALIAALGSDYKVVPAPDAQQAVRDIMRQSFDLLIANAHISDPDGFELIQLAQQKDPDIPALFTQNTPDLSLTQKMLSLPGTFPLSPPWEINLPMLVERALEFGTMRRVQRQRHQQTAAPNQSFGHITQRMALLGFRAMGMTHDIREAILSLQVNLEDLSETVELVTELLEKNAVGPHMDAKIKQEMVSLLRSQSGLGALYEANEQTALVARVVSATWSMLRGHMAIPGLCDIRQAIVRAHDDTRVLFARPVEVHVHGMPMARIDESSMVRSLTNVLSNAARATRGKGRVTVNASTLRGQVLVDVDDDGEGFSQDLLRAFDMNSMDALPAKYGPGYGLTISRDLLRAAGGELQLYRLDEGGSRVRIRIPAAGGGQA